MASAACICRKAIRDGRVTGPASVFVIPRKGGRSTIGLKKYPRGPDRENVPLPEKVRLKDKLKQVQRILDSEVAYRYADQALELLEEVKEKHPELFKGERVYLWEDLARLFDTMDLPEKAVLCFQHQAKLMPDSSDPYLNLGVLYATRGLITQA